MERHATNWADGRFHMTSRAQAPDGCHQVELTILMPCLDEAETLGSCIAKARSYIDRAEVSAEIVVADNGSSDGSADLARDLGARVIEVAERGYGAALNAGITAARGRFVVMGDADDSYDFRELDAFLDRLRGGCDLVMGNRFRGGIAPGAMPWHHRWIGNPALSWTGRRFFHVPVGDFHCGLRGFDRQRVLELGLHTTGMEWASELVVAAAMAGYEIDEVPTTLSVDGRSRRPHLRSFHDGWRHLRFLLLYSPRWLFLYPGLVMFTVGMFGTILLTSGPVTVGDVGFDIGTLILAAGVCIVGYSALWFAIISRDFAAREHLVVPTGRPRAIGRIWSLERGLALGAVLMVIGVVLTVISFARWRSTGFGALDGRQTVRTVLPAILGLALGAQTVFSSLFRSMLRLPTRRAS